MASGRYCCSCSRPWRRISVESRGPSMCSSTTCGRGAVELVPQPTHDHRVVDRREARDLPAQAAPGGLVLDLGGTQHLDHHRRVGHLVEGQPGLVRRAATEAAHGVSSGGDRRHPRRGASCRRGRSGLMPGQRRVSLRLRSLVWLADQSRFLSPPSRGPVAGLVAAAVVPVAADVGDGWRCCRWCRGSAVTGCRRRRRRRCRRRWCRRHRRRRPGRARWCRPRA